MEYLCLSTISVADFYKQLCFILGVPEKGGKTGMFKAIQEQITYLYKEKRQPLLLAIDEAQYLNTGILNDIKMLMNSGCDNVPPSREKSAVNPGTAQSGRRIWRKYRAVCAYRNVPPDIPDPVIKTALAFASAFANSFMSLSFSNIILENSGVLK